MKRIALCCLVNLFPSLLFAQPAIDTNALFVFLKSAPAAELPAAAALLVRHAPDSFRLATATNVVMVAVRFNPAASVAIVSEVCREAPDLAALLAVAAAREQPGLADEIARVATVHSPGLAGEIVGRVGQSAPNDLRSV